jgi:hypothetical protein
MLYTLLLCTYFSQMASSEVYIPNLLWFSPAMASIKSALPSLSKALSMSETTIYERQRALVRVGALKPVPGRGRGTGVELNSRNLATLLIGCGAFMSLADLDERVHQYIRAPFSGKGGFDLITGRKTLRDAIQAILEGKFTGLRPEDITGKFTGEVRAEAIICFNLQAPRADINWKRLVGLISVPDGHVSPGLSSFGHAFVHPGTGPGIDFRSYVSNETIETLRNLLTEAGAEE